MHAQRRRSAANKNSVLREEYRREDQYLSIEIQPYTNTHTVPGSCLGPGLPNRNRNTRHRHNHTCIRKCTAPCPTRVRTSPRTSRGIKHIISCICIGLTLTLPRTPPRTKYGGGECQMYLYLYLYLCVCVCVCVRVCVCEYNIDVCS